jgi:hypothetical protein
MPSAFVKNRSSILSIRLPLITLTEFAIKSLLFVKESVIYFMLDINLLNLLRDNKNISLNQS